jgi:hypothetical protein
MNCDVCKVEADEASTCEICGAVACPAHAEIEDDVMKCYYCLGKRSPFEDRDEGDFAGTEM